MKLILKKQMPFSYKENFTFYQPGTEFELVEKKEMYFDDTCQLGYMVSYAGCVFDGYTRADLFEEKK